MGKTDQPFLERGGTPADRVRIRLAARLLVRILLLIVTVFMAYAVSGLLMGAASGSGGPEAGGGSVDGARMLVPLVGVSAIDALVLLVLLERARWGGWKLAGAVFVLLFGVETFLSQMETFYFGSAARLTVTAVLSIVLAGGVRAILVAPAAVLVTGKARSRPDLEAAPAPSSARAWTWMPPVLSLAAAYVVVYVLFGYFVAWQVEEVRMFYTGSVELQPLPAHVYDRMLVGSPGLLPFQLFRGVLWAGLASLVVRMTAGGAGYHALATALLFGGVLSGLCLLPNPYMPDAVRMAHFVEILSSMLLFGALSGYVLSRWASWEDDRGSGHPADRS